MQTVFITGADRGIGFSLCEAFISAGWQVLAGQYMPTWPQLAELREKAAGKLHLVPLDVSDSASVGRAKEETARILGGAPLDMLLNCAGIALQGDSRENVLRSFGANTLGPLRMVDIFLPLMEGGGKRLCFVSSEAGSVAVAHRDGDASYCMSKTGLNMAVRLMFNQLQPQGYIFRLFHPGWVRSYMMGEKSTQGNYEPEEAAAAAMAQFCEDRPFEDVLVLTDIENRDWPF